VENFPLSLYFLGQVSWSHTTHTVTYRVIIKSLCIWWLQYKKQSSHNWWSEDGHHRIHSECGPCCTEHGLREHSSACQYMSGDWRGTLWTLLVTFCIVIISCTEIFFYHPVYFEEGKMLAEISELTAL